MYLKEAIELRIDELCKKKGITMNKLATICGITQSTLANWKVRPKSNISTITILRICRGMNGSGELSSKVILGVYEGTGISTPSHTIALRPVFTIKSNIHYIVENETKKLVN